MFGLSMTNILVLLILGVLLFGKRLPEVSRSVGKMIIDFKRAISGLEENFQMGNFMDFRPEPPPPPPPPTVRPPQRVAPTGRKFEDIPASPPSPIV